MPDLSLQERFSLLESDVTATPPRISSYHDLPFAMLLYEPETQWEARREMHLLANRLRSRNLNVTVISLGDLFWESVEKAEGIDKLIAFERKHGFKRAQSLAATYLTSEELGFNLTEILLNRLAELNAKRDIVFLWRAEVLAPEIFHVSTFLDLLKGKTDIPTILFYPGKSEGKELSFMGLLSRHSSRNYRVNAYI